MWRWGLIAEKQPRDQTGTCHAAREIAAARIKAAELDEIPVRRNIAVTTENATGALPEIGNDHDISFVISGAGFDPALPLAHFIGRSQVCISVSAPNLQAAEFVDQEEVDHTGDCVGTVHGRGAILQDVHVINHRKWYQVDVRAAAKSSGA